MTSHNKMLWGDKPYRSLNYELKSTYGEKIYKISLNAGLSCPNRNGTLGTGGCIFCSAGGSGDFATSPSNSIHQQIEDSKQQVSAKQQSIEPKYIAYFQAFTNTYGPIEYLKEIFTAAIYHPDILMLSIATRPDCLGDDVLNLLSELNNIKPVWVELGLQTIHEDTALLIRRGYPLYIFEKAVMELHQRNITVITHTILGLPGESKKDMILTVDYLSALPIQGIKLQLLHILKETDLGDYYLSGHFKDVLTLEDYVDCVISCIEHLPPEMVVHRITGDGPKELLLAPLWSSNKKMVLNTIHRTMKERNTWQSKNYNTGTGGT